MNGERGHFIELPVYICVCLSVRIKIAEGYYPLNRSLEFSEMKKLHNRSYGVVADFSFFRENIFQNPPIRRILVRKCTRLKSTALTVDMLFDL